MKKIRAFIAIPLPAEVHSYLKLLVREYRSLFGITSERIEKHNKKLIVMHPGPMNRGIEIDSGVADGDQAIILDQVLNGVASRMSILYLTLGGKPLID